MSVLPTNIDPKIYNLSSVIVGFALIGKLNALEQNAVGNWLITVGQILENNSAWQQVVEQKDNGTINSNSQHSDDLFNLDKLKDSIDTIRNELNNMQ